MKRIVVCCLVILGMAVAPAAPAGLVPDAEFQTGLELIAGYNYHESNFMRLDGTQFGLYGSFTYLGWDPLIPEIYLSYVGGDITYTGGYQSGGSLKGDVANYIFNFRALIGYALYANTLMIKPVTGLGYRYLFNDLEDLGAGGYTREQTYFYLPLGIDFSLPVNFDESVKIGLKTEFDVLLAGYHKAGSPVNADFTQDSGWGVRLAPNVIFVVSDQLGLLGEFYFQYWKIEKSDIDKGYLEPANTTTEYGIKAGVVY